MLSEERLRELRELESNATGGPWIVDNGSIATAWTRLLPLKNDGTPFKNAKPTRVQPFPCIFPALAPSQGNLNFVVAARNSITDLLDHIDEQAAEIARLRTALEKLTGKVSQ